MYFKRQLALFALFYFLHFLLSMDFPVVNKAVVGENKLVPSTALAAKQQVMHGNCMYIYVYMCKHMGESDWLVLLNAMAFKKFYSVCILSFFHDGTEPQTIWVVDHSFTLRL